MSLNFNTERILINANDFTIVIFPHTNGLLIFNNSYYNRPRNNSLVIPGEFSEEAFKKYFKSTFYHMKDESFEKLFKSTIWKNRGKLNWDKNDIWLFNAIDISTFLQVPTVLANSASDWWIGYLQNKNFFKTTKKYIAQQIKNGTYPEKLNSIKNFNKVHLEDLIYCFEQKLHLEDNWGMVSSQFFPAMYKNHSSLENFISYLAIKKEDLPNLLKFWDKYDSKSTFFNDLTSLRYYHYLQLKDIFDLPIEKKSHIKDLTKYFTLFNNAINQTNKFTYLTLYQSPNIKLEDGWLWATKDTMFSGEIGKKYHNCLKDIENFNSILVLYKNEIKDGACCSFVFGADYSYDYGRRLKNKWRIGQIRANNNNVRINAEAKKYCEKILTLLNKNNFKPEKLTIDNKVIELIAENNLAEQYFKKLLQNDYKQYKNHIKIITTKGNVAQSGRAQV